MRRAAVCVWSPGMRAVSAASPQVCSMLTEPSAVAQAAETVTLPVMTCS